MRGTMRAEVIRLLRARHKTAARAAPRIIVADDSGVALLGM
jgi:hypothetical protein